MSQILRPTAEKLYLYKGKDEGEDIFVESMLHQHHIDGIRFLYKHFKRKKAGVILNNPQGFGNPLQVTLFLGAIRHLLQSPILIISNDDEEYDWLELFQKHTQSYGLGLNVVVNAPHAFVKKSIFINNMKDIEKFVRRRWSVLVVDNQAFLKVKTLQMKFEADFKIWISPDDMKEQLTTFTLIYKWIYPKETFNAEDFKAKSGDRKDRISKAILLATFFEDIVFRTNSLTPFENSFGNEVRIANKVSEKNKDATGTKIKRSKRTVDDTNIINTDASAKKLPKINNAGTSTNVNHTSVSKLSNSDTIKSDTINTEDNNSDLDIDTFISSNDPIEKDMHDFDNISNESPENNDVLHYDDSMECETDVSKSLDHTTKADITSNEQIPNQDVKMSSDSDDDAYELETQEFLNDNNVENNESDCEKNNIGEEFPKIDYNDIDENRSYGTQKVGLGNNLNVNNEKIKSLDIIEEPQEKNKDELTNKEEIKDEIKLEEAQNVKKEFKHSAVDIDTKISEHEERIFKKFKGTFLDSIFK